MLTLTRTRMQNLVDCCSMFEASAGTFLAPQLAVGPSKLFHVAKEDGKRMRDLLWQCRWQASLSHDHAAEIVSLTL